MQGEGGPVAVALARILPGVHLCRFEPLVALQVLHTVVCHGGFVVPTDAVHPTVQVTAFMAAPVLEI